MATLHACVRNVTTARIALAIAPPNPAGSGSVTLSWHGTCGGWLLGTNPRATWRRRLLDFVLNRRTASTATILVASLFFVVNIARGGISGGTITGYAGGGNGDGGSPENAIIDPRGLAAVTTRSGASDLYVVDGVNHRVRLVSGGVVTSIAGTGVAGYSGDGGPSENAQLSAPQDVDVDASGNIFIADADNNRVRRIDAATGRISTVAGNGFSTFFGDTGSATLASLAHPYAVAVGPNGVLYIADFVNSRVRKVVNGIITTVAGNGTSGYSGDNGPAPAAALKNPTDVAVDSAGNLYIADYLNHRIRRVSPNGIITTVVGSGAPGFSGDNGPAQNAQLSYPLRIAFDLNDNLIIADGGSRRLRQVNRSTQSIITIAGSGAEGTGGDEGPALRAEFDPISGVAVAENNDIYVAVTKGQGASTRDRVRRIDGNDIIHQAVGGGIGDGEAATEALIDPRGMTALEGRGTFPDLYVADAAQHRVRFVDGASGTIETIVGNGVPGYNGDKGPALSASLNTPRDVAIDSNGNLYVSDSANNVIRRVSQGVITTVAGNGTAGYGGDGGPATNANLSSPFGITVDQNGVLYIADFINSRIRKVENGTISTVAGNGQWGFSGDSGPAIAARLANPTDMAVAPDGSLYIADFLNNRIRRVNPQGTITTYAGGSVAAFAGDSGPAWASLLYRPLLLSIDRAGNLFIADSQNHRVRCIDTTGFMHTVAGNGIDVDAGDGGLSTLASLSEPFGVAVDPSGSHLFVSVPASLRARLVTLQSQPIPTATPTFTPRPLPATPTRSFTPTLTPTFTRIPSTPTFTPTWTRPPTATFTHTPTKSPTAPSPTNTSGPAPTLTFTPTKIPPTLTATAVAPTPTRTPTGPTPTRTRTPTPTSTLARTNTPTSTHSPTRTRTPSRASTAAQTNTPTSTRTPSHTATNPPATATRTPTRTPVVLRTGTPTRTSSPVPTLTRTRTPSRTPTASDTPTMTRTRTPTVVRTSTPTRAPTGTITPTRTRTPTRVRTATPLFRPFGVRREIYLGRLGIPIP